MRGRARHHDPDDRRQRCARHVPVQRRHLQRVGERRAGHRPRDAHRNEPGQRDHRAVQRRPTAPPRLDPAATIPTASQTLTFAALEAFKDVEIPILDESLPEGNETVLSLALSNPSAGATLGATKTAVLTILDDEQTLQFSAPVYVVNESAGTVTVTVTRSGPTVGSVTVDYATAAGTATSGVDYTDVSGTLTFAAGHRQPDLHRADRERHPLRGRGVDCARAASSRRRRPAGSAEHRHHHHSRQRSARRDPLQRRRLHGLGVGRGGHDHGAADSGRDRQRGDGGLRDGGRRHRHRRRRLHADLRHADLQGR